MRKDHVGRSLLDVAVVRAAYPYEREGQILHYLVCTCIVRVTEGQVRFHRAEICSAPHGEWGGIAPVHRDG